MGILIRPMSGRLVHSMIFDDCETLVLIIVGQYIEPPRLLPGVSHGYPLVHTFLRNGRIVKCSPEEHLAMRVCVTRSWLGGHRIH